MTQRSLLPRVRFLRERSFQSPFGGVVLPSVELPPVQTLTLTKERRAAFGHTIGADLSGIIALVPVVGDFIADNIKTTHHEAIRKIMTPEEFNLFVKRNKLAPLDTFALFRAYVEKDIGI